MWQDFRDGSTERDHSGLRGALRLWINKTEVRERSFNKTLSATVGQGSDKLKNVNDDDMAALQDFSLRHVEDEAGNDWFRNADSIEEPSSKRRKALEDAKTTDAEAAKTTEAATETKQDAEEKAALEKEEKKAAARQKKFQGAALAELKANLQKKVREEFDRGVSALQGVLKDMVEFFVSENQRNDLDEPMREYMIRLRTMIGLLKTWLGDSEPVKFDVLGKETVLLQVPSQTIEEQIQNLSEAVTTKPLPAKDTLRSLCDGLQGLQDVCAVDESYASVVDQIKTLKQFGQGLKKSYQDPKGYRKRLDKAEESARLKKAWHLVAACRTPLTRLIHTHPYTCARAYPIAAHLLFAHRPLPVCVFSMRCICKHTAGQRRGEEGRGRSQGESQDACRQCGSRKNCTEVLGKHGQQ